MVKCLTSQPAPKSSTIRWRPLKGSVATIIFVVLAVLAEFLVVFFAMDLGVKDVGQLTTNWPFNITISTSFELVPIAVVIALTFTWIYLTKKVSARTLQPIGRAELRQPASKKSQAAKSLVEKAKPSPPSAKGVSRIWQKIYSARASIKSALMIFLVFAILVLIVSLLAFPNVIYQAITSSYQSHSPFYNFVISVANSLRGFARAVSPIGWIATAINNALLAIAPGVRAIGTAFGSLIAPLANLDPAGKYLAFQNVAVWISVFLALLYGQSAHRSYRYRKK